MPARPRACRREFKISIVWLEVTSAWSIRDRIISRPATKKKMNTALHGHVTATRNAIQPLTMSSSCPAPSVSTLITSGRLNITFARG